MPLSSLARIITRRCRSSSSDDPDWVAKMVTTAILNPLISASISERMEIRASVARSTRISSDSALVYATSRSSLWARILATTALHWPSVFDEVLTISRVIFERIV